MTDYLLKAEKGFSTLNLPDVYKVEALKFLKIWLEEPEYCEYVGQIQHLIDTEKWDYLLDCFYQIIPFGTGGRRGEVGIGPNRINLITIKHSAQGHSQFLLKKYGDEAKKRGVVLAYDIRQFFPDFSLCKNFNEKISNPILNLSCKDMAEASASVYTANDLKTYIFDSFRTTPELSFAIRELKAVAGGMFSASHNPPEHNGIKVFDEFGGQLIPPFDEDLVKEVTSNVKEVKTIEYSKGVSTGLLKVIGKEIDEKYFSVFQSLSLNPERDIKVVYTPLHGCGSTSVLPVMKKLGLNITPCPKTSNPSGRFENVTFNIPNPEVEQSFETTVDYAKQIDADIVISSDPDADRFGVMVKHKDNWVYFNGNEIGAILTEYAVNNKKYDGITKRVAIKSEVTTNLISRICEANNVEIIGNLLVGFKYVGEEMNKLESKKEMERLLLACEESHGFISGNYIREKDAVLPAIWIAELASKLKKNGITLVDYLNEIYAKYGFYANYLTEIRLPGAEGMSLIKKIQDGLRQTKPPEMGNFKISSIDDWQDRKPIVSETDKVSKNALVFNFELLTGTSSIKVTIRPSGTEPKVKFYMEVGTLPFDLEQIETKRKQTWDLMRELEKSVLIYCYKLIGIDFPQRGFLLFWQLPAKDKLHYFEIEQQIADLKDSVDKKAKLTELLGFLGSDPISKVDKAFKEKYAQGINEYLEID